MQGITIPLRYVAGQEIGNPEDYFKVINDEYATRYLEQLGVAPTHSNKQAVLRNMPLRECEMQASWASRTSSVADSVTILPPQKKKLSGVQAGNSLEKQDKKQWYGQAEYLNVAPPEVKIIVSNNNRDDDENAHDSAQREAELREELRANDHHLSEGANPRLTKEVERARLMRGGADVSAKEMDELNEERRRSQEHELKSLKDKFILPFCCERYVEGGGKILVSWHSPAFQGELHIEVPEVLRQEVLQPISITVDEIYNETSKFVQESLPLELLTVRQHRKHYFDEVRSQLVSNRISRLAGLLSHYLYWNTLGHLHHERQLPESSKHSLLLTIHEIWSTLEAGHKDSRMGVSFVLPALIIVLKWTVERCLTIQYPKLMVDEELHQQLLDRINVLFMRLFDPDCRYAYFGAFGGSSKASKLVRKLELIQAAMGEGNTKRTLHKLNRATPLLHKVVKEGGCIDPKTRALMSRNESEGQLPTKKGTAESVDETAPQQAQQMDNWKLQELYRVALKRLGPSLSDKGLAPSPAPPGQTPKNGGAHGLKGSQSSGALLQQPRQQGEASVKLPPVDKKSKGGGKVQFAAG